LAVGDTPKIIQDADLELLHAQRVAEHIYRLIERPEPGEARPAGVVLTVTELLRKLSEAKDFYGAQLIPPLQDSFELDLFNTYRSYLFPQHYPVLSARREDERGNLFEAVKSLHGGQCFISTTKPGITRGNHYHRRKIERFLVLSGDATIRVRKMFSPQAVDFPVSGATPQYVDMPTLHTHNITNTGADELVTLFWAHEIFDPEQPDTYKEIV
jgi:UDP-2-acetamido-2,6-beta-L-arabino-hexul-4-ose reductase